MASRTKGTTIVFDHGVWNTCGESLAVIAVPPAIGSEYRSPRMSNTIDWPSGATSSEIHDASSVVKRSVRGVASGSPLLRATARTALSFCAVVCAPVGAAAARAIAREEPIRRCSVMH